MTLNYESNKAQQLFPETRIKEELGDIDTQYEEIINYPMSILVNYKEVKFIWYTYEVESIKTR